MLKVSEVLTVKGHTLFTATPATLVTQALQTMSTHDIGSLVIMQRGQLVGMLTFREIIRYLSEHHATIGDVLIEDIMERHPVSVSPDTLATEVQRLMLEHHSRYMPVIDGEMLLGVISFYDMAQAIAAAQKFENSMLKAYIRDWPNDTEPSEKN
jgi:CBS domain-containing protein